MAPEVRIGPYTVLRRLGEGGMGEVYLARSPGGRKVAVKTIRAEHLDDPSFRARFRTEVLAARRVSGAFTAAVVDADPEAPIPWLATAFVDGPTLAEHVAEHGPLPTAELRRLVAGLAEALASVHAAGVLHRDLKPGNIMLATDGPRLIDFGISRAIEAHSQLPGRPAAGTPGYIAPERLAGAEASEASDVFSLGAVLCFAATGAGPFGSGPAAVLDARVVAAEPDLDDIGEPLIRMIAGYCLDRDPAARPGVADILGMLAGRPFAPARTPPSGAGWRVSRLRRRTRIILGSVAGAAVLAVAAVFALFMPGSEGSTDFAWSIAAPEYASMLGLWSGSNVVVMGTESAGLTGYDAATGKTLWTWKPPSGNALCAMSHDTSAGVGAVMYGATALGGISVPSCSELQTVSVDSGQSKWSEPVSLTVSTAAGPTQSGVHSLSVAGGLVSAPYFATADEAAGQGADTDFLVASIASGKPQWSTDFGTGDLPNGCQLTGTARIFDGKAYTFASCKDASRTDLFAIDGAKASTTKDLGEISDCTSGYLAADDAYLLIDCPGSSASGGSGLYALHAGSSPLVPITAVTATVAAAGGTTGNLEQPGGPLLDGATLYLAKPRSGTSAAEVVAVDLATGKAKWTHRIPDMSALVPLTASASGVEVVAADGAAPSAQLLRLDATSGTLGSTQALAAAPAAVFASFTSGSDLPYAATSGGFIAIGFPEATMSGNKLLDVIGTG